MASDRDTIIVPTKKIILDIFLVALGKFKKGYVENDM